jgi:hypothetical protein
MFAEIILAWSFKPFACGPTRAADTIDIMAMHRSHCQTVHAIAAKPATCYPPRCPRAGIATEAVEYGNSGAGQRRRAITKV